MSITIELSPVVEAALRAEAEAQGRSIETIAAERLAELYEDADADDDPEAVEGIRRGLDAVKAGAVMAFEDYVKVSISRRA